MLACVKPEIRRKSSSTTDPTSNSSPEGNFAIVIRARSGVALPMRRVTIRYIPVLAAGIAGRSTMLPAITWPPGTRFWWRRDHATARNEFKRALALKPDDPLTHHWLANALLANGEPEAALREIERARELDPVSTSIVADRAAILYFAGRRAEGLANMHALAREQPGDVGVHRTLAEIALFEGRSDEFLRESAMTARLRSDAVGLSQIERWRSVGPGTRAIEEAMLRDARMTGAGWFQIAKLEALAGRRGEAEEALARACKAHEPATISAPSNLWLSRALSPDDIAARCGRTTPLS